MFTQTDCHIYNVSEFDTVANIIRGDMKTVKKRKVEYYNIPCAFDIETTSFYDNGEKVGLMYVWQFGISGHVFIGRLWDEFKQLLCKLRNEFDISVDTRLVIYVHNLAFEFQFIRKLFNWFKVFSIDSRKPIYATNCYGFEFRCSYLLSGYSLAKVGDNLTKYKCDKMVGDLDYSLKRHYKTPLTKEELKYCFNDVMVVMCYIQERIEIDGDITKIPLTKTGYVRNYCRNMCLHANKSHKKDGKKFKTYHEMIKSLSIEVDEYKQLKRAFMGGFTHSNAINTNIVLNDVKSFDFTSSYPYCMISEMYPMSKGKVIEVDENTFEKYLNQYCCVFDIQFTNLIASLNYENYISYSKCYKCVNPVINNGRLVCCDSMWTTITNVDYDIIKRCYSWDGIKIANFRIYQKGYLPTQFVKSIIKLYQDKTQLKGVEGKEVEYMQSKEMLNSCYGMCVTDIARDEFVYENDVWSTIKPTDEKLESELDKYNNSKKRFLFYVWGIFVTAYARRNLFTGIFEFKNDYIYSDTDSIKVVNYNNHMEYINKYNDITQRKLQKACEYHGLDMAELQPKTIKGETKLLGIWDNDGVYDAFKTLGAKRYMYKQGDKRYVCKQSTKRYMYKRNIHKQGVKLYMYKQGDAYHITIAGTNKHLGNKYVKSLKDPFDAFNDGLVIPPQFTGKLTHTYIDETKQGVILDYRGVAVEYTALSGIHMEPCEYNLSLSSGYIDYLMGVKETWK